MTPPTTHRRSLSDHIGVLILTVATAARGVSYAPGVTDRTTPAHWLEYVATVHQWCVVWLAVAVVGAVGVVCRRVQPAALGLMLGLHAAWCISFLGSSLITDGGRGWVSAISYGVIVLLALWGFGRSPATPMGITSPDRNDV